MRHAVFKCHFGGEHGWGHISRSSALATVLRERGWRTSLWSDGDSSALPREIVNAFERKVVDPFADETFESADLLCIDEMYTSEAELQRLADRWRSLSGRKLIVALDDMRLRRLEGFDLVVNAEIGLREAGYGATRCLLGERYALLRGGFSFLATARQEILPNDVAPVLVMIGGTDPFGYAEKALDALALVDCERYAPLLVGGATDCAAARRESLSRFRCARDLGRLESGELAASMRGCAFGIVGCGASLCELAAVSLPFIGLLLVDNQRSNGNRAGELWGMPILDREGRHAAPLDLRSAVEKVEKRRAELQGRSFSEVDGLGAARVADAIEEMLVS